MSHIVRVEADEILNQLPSVFVFMNSIVFMVILLCPRGNTLNLTHP